MIGEQSSTSEVSSHYALAEAAVKAGDLTKAAAEYREVTHLDPSNAAAWTGLGVLQYGAGTPGLAVETLNKALSLNTSDKRAAIFLGLSNADLGQCTKAVPLLDPEFPALPQGKLQRLVGFALLDCLSATADAQHSLLIAGKLKQLYPDDPDVLYKSAELYLRLWSHDADTLIRTHPESYRVHQLAGELYEGQGKRDLAIREYRAALSENPHLPQMHYRIAQLLLREGEAQSSDQVDDEAVRELQAELTVDSQSFVSLYSEAEIERHQHKLAAAEQHYRQAVALNPGYADARVGLAQMLYDSKAIAPAISELNNALRDDPKNAQAHYLLMLCYRQQGDMTRASLEQTSFRQLQQQKAESFQSRIDALLNSSVTQATGTSHVQ